MELREFIDYTLIPALYERLDQPGVLEEFGFKRRGSHFISTTRAKINGRHGSKPGQVYVYPNNAARLVDHTESPSSMEVIRYVQTIREGKDIGFWNALQSLCEMADVIAPRREQSEEDREALEKARRRAEIWEAVIEFCRQNIRNPDYKAEAAPIIEYLRGQRKYTDADISAMQLGYLRNTGDLTAYLLGNGFSREEIESAVKLPVNAGMTHRLVIPLRNASGEAAGITLRNVQYSGEGVKYIFNTGLNKGSFLFNLHGKALDGKAVIVEGPIDTAIANARGYSFGSICALGGKTITAGQISHLVKAGTRTVFIALDNEPGTAPQIEQLIHKLKECESIEDNIFIVSFPDGIKDADEMITRHGIDAFTDCVRNATEYYTYFANQRIEEIQKLQDAGQWTNQLTHHYIDEIVRIGIQIADPAKRKLFTDGLPMSGLPLDAAAMQESIVRIRYRKEEADQREALKKLVHKTGQLISSGADNETVLKELRAVQYLQQKSKLKEYDEINAIQHDTASIMQRMINIPDSVNMGYRITIDGLPMELSFPSGQLTFIAAGTGHGKTRFLINTALNVLREYNEKEVYFFTFEQSAEQIVIFFLNVFMNIRLNKGRNRDALNDYFKRGGDMKYITRDVHDEFNRLRKEFDEKIVPRLKVLHLDYSAEELIRYIEHMRTKNDRFVVMIDYIQKLRSNQAGSLTARQTELKFICEDFNAMAIRTGLPVVFGAQFNRDVATPVDMHPTRMSEASDIEKIASEIYGIWDCTQKMGRTPNKDEAKRIFSEYDMEILNEMKREDAIILEIVKSRRLGTGYHVKLPIDRHTGYVGHSLPVVNKSIGYF